MGFPLSVKEKIKNLYYELGKSEAVKFQKNLTNKYKNRTGESTSLIESKNDSLIYAISRMPATYEVIYGLLKDLTSQKFLPEDFASICDAGAGTGAGYFAINQLFNAKTCFIERDHNMIDVFKMLTGSENIISGDILKLEMAEKFDLVLSSYVLSEMTETDRENALKKLFSLSNRFVLLVDTGTPAVYHEYMKLKEMGKTFGFSVIAPCKNEVCPLENDYCQFYARVERSAVHREAKQATLSFEDEKYFYLLFEKNDFINTENEKFDDSVRVIRRPIKKEGLVELKVCYSSGVKNLRITKKDREKYKFARKIKINEQMKVWYGI